MASVLLDLKLADLARKLELDDLLEKARKSGVENEMELARENLEWQRQEELRRQAEERQRLVNLRRQKIREAKKAAMEALEAEGSMSMDDSDDDTDSEKDSEEEEAEKVAEAAKDPWASV